MRVAAAASRALGQRLVIDGDASDDVAAALAFRLPPTDVPAVLLAELRARQGRHEEVLGLWAREFPHYLGALARQPPDPLALAYDEGAAAAWRMGLALQAAGATTQAGEALAVALALNRDRLRRTAGQSPVLEAQLGGFQQHRWLAAAAVQLALQSGDTAHLTLAVGAIAASKGLVNRYGQRRRALLATVDDRTVRQARPLIEALESRLLQLPIDGEAGMRAWSQWVNDYAAALAPALPALERAGLSGVVADADALLVQVRAALAPGEVLVGFVQMQPLAPLQARAAPARYVRYTIGADGITLRDLGPRKDVDRAVAAWRSSESTRQGEVGHALTALLLAGLPADVGASTRWVLDPDGLLGLLPFEALPDAGGGLLLDRRTVRYVTSMAQLADQRAPHPASRNPALVFADPAYAAAPSALASTGLPLQMAGGAAWRDVVFRALPETRMEGDSVKAALRSLGIETHVVTGADATPGALRRAEAPAFLHIASHGYMLSPAPDGDPQAGQRVRMIVPGLLAGLALSPDDGGPVFTGSDLAALNLRGTRLLVLSACDTGNGSIDVHEGLTSLRRAAEEAGARATVTSLWAVPSNSTVKLMGHFYSRLAAGQSHSEALRSAKLALRQDGGGTRDWAGFVLSGADR